MSRVLRFNFVGAGLYRGPIPPQDHRSAHLPQNLEIERVRISACLHCVDQSYGAARQTPVTHSTKCNRARIQNLQFTVTRLLPRLNTFLVAKMSLFGQTLLLAGLFRDACNEMTAYTNQMNTTHWGIVAGCAVAFGFLCLKGSGVNR